MFLTVLVWPVYTQYIRCTQVVMRNSSGQVIGTYQQPLDSGYGQYNQKPNWYDIEIWNRQWTHKVGATARQRVSGRRVTAR